MDTEREKSTSDHQRQRRCSLDYTDGTPEKPRYLATAVVDLCDQKQPRIPAPCPPASSSCTCSRSKLLRIDNHLKGLHVDIHRGLFSNKAADTNSNWYQRLLANVRWHRVKYKSNRFQKDCETPCWTAFYGGRSEHRPYAPVPPWFQPLIDQVTSHLGSGVTFNAFLLRLYFDGKDEIAWHTDGRKFLGDHPTIASLSLGCKATFQLRRMNEVWPCADGSKSTEGCVDADTPIESFVLSDGDLLVMRGETQKHWHHRVPKEKGRGVRLNINFRYVLPGLDSERGQRTYYKYMVYGDCPMDGQPPSWTFDEIMAKRGGMMNFVQRGLKRKAIKYDVGKTDELSTQEAKEGKRSKLNESLSKTVGTAAPFAKAMHSSNTEGCETDIHDYDTQQYLTNEQQSIDPDVFIALPSEIRSELVSQWKSQQSNQSITTIATLPNPQRNTANTKNNSNKRCDDKSVIKGKTKSSCRNGTIDSFFAKK